MHGEDTNLGSVYFRVPGIEKVHIVEWISELKYLRFSLYLLTFILILWKK